MRDYQESVTTGQTHTHTRTDRRRTKLSLCAAMLRRRQKLDMCFWNMDAPRATKSKYGKNLLSPTFWSHPQGHVMSMKYEEPIEELTVQVWLLYHHPNFKYCTLFVRTELWTDKQTEGRMYHPITRCPWLTFQARGIKNQCKYNIYSGSICTICS